MISTGPTNYVVRGIINSLEKEYRKSKKPFLARVIKELKRPTRKKSEVNISKINRYTPEGSNVFVFGKVLSAGTLDHKVNIVAFKYSKSAVAKLKSSKSTIKTLKDWASKPVAPSKVIILG
ncbi:50S ribosomal protein L18e [Candidatus Tiddalikarchaeum anstoanum]|nr:50S ribosomal protein L18e [Candidatus Tiddalikarchaeum anstoanum]